MRMGHTFRLLVSALLALGFSAGRAEEPNPGKRKPPVAIENGKVFEKDGRRYLWGGENEAWNFDITTFRLDPARLHYGMGREFIPALVRPEFIPAKEAGTWLADDKRVLLVHIGEEVKIYPADLLRRHQVVNDIVGGRPILAGYCVLSDFWAAFDRRIHGRTFTFAASGYGYSDPEHLAGRDAFVLWDRETESLWWPVIGKAVAGPLIDTPLAALEANLWSETTWGEVKGKYPSAVVLAPGQTMEPPANWPRYDPAELKKGK